MRLGAEAVNSGGATGVEREFYLSMGYRGRHPGGLMHKALPRPRRLDLAQLVRSETPVAKGHVPIWFSGQGW